MLVKWIAVLVMIGACLLVIFISNRVFRRIHEKTTKLHLRLAGGLINTIAIIITLYGCFSQFDATREISTTIFRSSSLVLALVTFAAQHALGNVISGFALSVSQPIEVGDKVKVLSGNSVIVEGVVKDITMRHTVVMQYNGESCIVPNSIMDSSVIINANYIEEVGNFIEVEIAYDADVELADKIMTKICVDNPLTLRKDIQVVRLSRFEAEGVVLKTTVWFDNLNDSFEGCDQIRREILKQFAANGIVIPYHTVTVNVNKQ